MPPHRWLARHANVTETSACCGALPERIRNVECYVQGTMTVLLDHALIAAYDADTGRVDGLRLAESLSFRTGEMALIVGVTTRGLRKNPTTPQLQTALTRLVALVTLLREMLDGSMPFVRIWLRAPHPDLGGRTPFSYLVGGQMDVVENLASAIANGQPA